MQFIKLVIVSTNDLIRNGIQMLIHDTGSIEVVHVCTTLFEGEEYLKKNRVKVLLLDDMLPGYLSPIQAITELNNIQPTLQIIILSDLLSEHYVQRLIHAGVSGFIYKEDQLEDTLVAGIKSAAAGYLYLSPQASALPYGRSRNKDLNRSDLEVLHLIAKGYTNQEIAARMDLTDRSVYRIRQKLREYLDVRTNEQMVEAAIRRGLLKRADTHLPDRH